MNSILSFIFEAVRDISNSLTNKKIRNCEITIAESKMRVNCEKYDCECFKKIKELDYLYRSIDNYLYDNKIELSDYVREHKLINREIEFLEQKKADLIEKCTDDEKFVLYEREIDAFDKAIIKLHKDMR